MLHTKGGFNAHIQSAAALLATQGFVTLAPDYFTPLGVTDGTFDLNTFWVRHTDEAKDVIAKALECLKSLSFVDRNRIGAVGYSLGGYFAFVLATRDDVKGVVSYYGAYHGSPVSPIPTKYSFTDIVLQTRAPVLMLHGDGDTTVIIIRAQVVRALLILGGKTSEFIVYPGVEHAFDQVGTPTFDASATVDALVKTLDFLRATLK